MRVNNSKSTPAVNSFLPISGDFPPLSSKEDHFASISIALGGRGLLVLRRLVYLCGKNDDISCVVSQEALSRRAKCSSTTIKEKIGLLTGFGLIIKQNRLPAWVRDEDGKRKPRWRSNRYIFTDLGLLFMGQWKSGKKLRTQGSQRHPDDLWERSKPNRESDKRVRQVCELQEKIRDEYVASRVATFSFKKEEKKGESFFYGMERETDETGSDESSANAEREGKPHHANADRNARDKGRAKTKATRENLSKTQSANDPNRPTERRSTAQESRNVANHIRTRTIRGSCRVGADWKDLRQKNTTSDLINREVVEWTSRDPVTYGALANLVHGFRKDNIAPSVILRVVRKVCESGMQYWRNWANKLATEYSKEEEQLKCAKEKRDREISETRKVYEILEEEKRNRVGAVDLTTMVLQAKRGKLTIA